MGLVHVKARRLLAVIVLALLAGCATGPQRSVAGEDVRADAAQAYQAGEYERAQLAYEQLLEEAPKDAQAWFRLGNIYVFTQRLEPAAAAYRQVLALDPEHARARHNLGLIYIELGVEALLQARPQLPRVDEQAAGTMRYLACIMETFMGHPRPSTCEPPASE